jgi:hypothetical protein
MADDRDEDRQDGFLGRWSKRKREISARGKIAEVCESQNSDDETQGPQDTSGDDKENRDREELEAANRAAAEAVDLESLGYESDFSTFLKTGVPSALRSKAMRKLWTSNPLLANLDGLNDYDQDFADPRLNVFQSIWQVGRGFLTSSELDGQHKEVSTAEPPQSASTEPVNSEGDRETKSSGSVEAEPETEMQEAPGEAATEGGTETETLQDEGVARVSIRTRLKG